MNQLVAVAAAPSATRTFNELPEFEVNLPRSLQNRHVVDELARLIAAHGAQDRLGVCLLHKHFALDDDEVIVERITHESAHIGPQALAGAAPLVPYMWRYSSAVKTWLPVEFVEADSISDGLGEFVRTELPAMTELLAEAAAYLQAKGLDDVYGIALLHRGRLFGDARPGKLWETDGDRKRALILRTIPLPEVESSEWMETLWQFENGRAEAFVFCENHTVTADGPTCQAVYRGGGPDLPTTC